MICISCVSSPSSEAVSSVAYRLPSPVAAPPSTITSRTCAAPWHSSTRCAAGAAASSRTRTDAAPSGTARALDTGVSRTSSASTPLTPVTNGSLSGAHACADSSKIALRCSRPASAVQVHSSTCACALAAIPSAAPGSSTLCTYVVAAEKPNASPDGLSHSSSSVRLPLARTASCCACASHAPSCVPAHSTRAATRPSGSGISLSIRVCDTAAPTRVSIPITLVCTSIRRSSRLVVLALFVCRPPPRYAPPPPARSVHPFSFSLCSFFSFRKRKERTKEKKP